ncbi:MAG TPA: aspartate kinase, partial [Pseudobdellovibrionaceae bacterium]|nr:aspartate kinase [Pseudobdellovibrionaceae bacterium]
MIISKFGGTSMGDAECMLRSAQVCLKQKSNLVVVSATSGTTNELIKIGKLAEDQKYSQAEEVIQKIITRHQKMAQDLHCSPNDHTQLLELFNELQSLSKGIFLLRDCSLKAMDALTSLGERLSSVLFKKALLVALENDKKTKNVKLVDARSLLKTDDQFGKAKPLFDEVQKLCEVNLSFLNEANTLAVTQGFIGSTLEGHTTTLGRGGSDYSAAIFAEALNAQVLEIWTDVDGIATTDPRICSNAQSIKDISFKEASELAIFGAKVLHPATLLPAMRKNIPTFVGSSFHIESHGTWIHKETQTYP